MDQYTESTKRPSENNQDNQEIVLDISVDWDNLSRPYRFYSLLFYTSGNEKFRS